MKAATILSLCLGITFGIDRLPAQDQAELELDHNVKSTFVTPHTAWAKPYVSGTTRVLFFVDGRGTNPREVVELKQRFDLDPQMVFWTRIIDSTQEQWHGADLGIHRMARLLEEHWDAFVFLDVPLERVPVEQQYTLLKAVTSGAGLVLIGFDDKRHYNLKTKQIEAALAEKHPEPFQDFVHKDQWTTFKYSDSRPS